jgi:hypothetical protein
MIVAVFPFLWSAWRDHFVFLVQCSVRCAKGRTTRVSSRAVEPCRARKVIQLRYAVLSELVRLLAFAIVIARDEGGERQCNDSGNKSHRYLGRHGHFLLL